MAFLVADFQDFLALLKSNPEWQVELRRILVADEIASLRRAVERLEETVRAIIERTDARLARLEADVVYIKGDITVMKGDIIDIKGNIHVLNDNVARLKGGDLEAWYERRAAAVFGRTLDQVSVVSPGAIAGLRDAWKTGTITEEEWDDVRDVDLVVEGVDRAGKRLRLAIEISSKADDDDVVRAVRRAGIVGRAGAPCIPVVGTEDAAVVEVFARANRTALFRRGTLVYWPD